MNFSLPSLRRATLLLSLTSVACSADTLSEVKCTKGELDCECLDDGTCHEPLVCNVDTFSCVWPASGDPNDPGDSAGGDPIAPPSDPDIEPCDPPGTYTSSPNVSYTCAGSLVNLQITEWLMTEGDNDEVVVTGDSSTSGSLTGPMPICPGGSFLVSTVQEGGCCETYTLSGTFTDDDTWSGTFTVEFCQSSSCGCSAGDGFSCTLGMCQDQSIAVMGSR